MNEHEFKSRVAPPAAYKAPSLPTLAALGAISAAALLSGCGPRRPVIAGGITSPSDYRELVDEKGEPEPELPAAEKKATNEIPLKISDEFPFDVFMVELPGDRVLSVE